MHWDKAADEMDLSREWLRERVRELAAQFPDAYAEACRAIEEPEAADVLTRTTGHLAAHCADIVDGSTPTATTSKISPGPSTFHLGCDEIVGACGRTRSSSVWFSERPPWDLASWNPRCRQVRPGMRSTQDSFLAQKPATALTRQQTPRGTSVLGLR